MMKQIDNLYKKLISCTESVYISEEYKKLDHEIRLRLLKEIQVILNEYVLARENGDLKNWKAMYGEIGHYIKNFFYYRMDEKYEAEKKALKDYKFLDEV